MVVGFTYLGLWLSIMGYLIPVWVLAVVLSDLLRLLSEIIFSLAVAFYGLGRVYSYGGGILNMLYAKVYYFGSIV
jgi:hypothetical protein